MKRIHAYLTGRLGNQLFQYAFAKKLQKIYGGQIIFNIYDLEHRSKNYKHTLTKFNYDMMNFKLNNEIEIEDVKLKWYADFCNPITKIIRFIFPKIFFKIMAKKGYLIWLKNKYINIPKLKTEDIYIIGWWQDFRFFHEAEEDLKNMIVPIVPRVKKNMFIYDKAKNKNSVCVSIRGGNYLVPKIKKILFVCDKEYFYNAIKKMCKELDNPVFIIFSDDLKWVKEYINFEKKFPNLNFYYEDGSDSVEEKMRMMVECNNFIISNSSFSWWAQYLCLNKEKKVIAPKYWFTNKKKNGLYMDNWILIDTNE